MNSSQLTYGQITFRSPEPEDIDLLYQWENDPLLWKVSNTITPFSRFILKQYIQEAHRDIYETKQLRLMIQDLNKRPVGAIDLFDFDPYHQRAGVGILIYDHNDRGKGFASDSLKLMSEYATEILGLHQLYANIAADNKASISLFEKSGFRLAGTKTDWLKNATGWIDEMIYQKILS